MYILVEILHTEFQYISLIEMQKYNWNRKRIEKRKTWKKRDLLSRLVTPTGTKGCASHVDTGCTLPTGTKGPLLSRLPHPGQKGTPFVPDWRSRLGNRDNRSFPTGTNQYFCSSEMKICIAFRHSRLMRTHPETQYVILLINKTIWSFKNWWFKSHVSYMLFWCLEGACKKRKKNMHCLEKKIFQSC